MVLGLSEESYARDNVFCGLIGAVPNLKEIKMCSTFANLFENTKEIEMSCGYGEYKNVPITIDD